MAFAVNAEPYASQVHIDKVSAANTMANLEVAQLGPYVHAEGADTGTIDIVQLPPGKIRVYSDLSRIVTSQFATGADLHLGYRAHTQEDGTAVVEDDNAFLDDEDAGGAALDKAFVLPAGGVLDLDSQKGVVLFITIDTGNIEDADTIDGYVVYSRIS